MFRVRSIGSSADAPFGADNRQIEICDSHKGRNRSENLALTRTSAAKPGNRLPRYGEAILRLAKSQAGEAPKAQFLLLQSPRDVAVEIVVAQWRKEN